MTRDDIIRMAKEAGGDDWGIFRDFMPELEQFASLVAKYEREACAKVCDIEANDWYEEGTWTNCAHYLARTIRAREQHGSV